jgi:hypothetical protein
MSDFPFFNGGDLSMTGFSGVLETVIRGKPQTDLKCEERVLDSAKRGMINLNPTEVKTAMTPSALNGSIFRATNVLFSKFKLLITGHI